MLTTLIHYTIVKPGGKSLSVRERSVGDDFGVGRMFQSGEVGFCEGHRGDEAGWVVVN